MLIKATAICLQPCSSSLSFLSSIVSSSSPSLSFPYPFFLPFLPAFFPLPPSIFPGLPTILTLPHSPLLPWYPPSPSHLLTSFLLPLLLTSFLRLSPLSFSSPPLLRPSCPSFPPHPFVPPGITPLLLTSPSQE